MRESLLGLGAMLAERPAGLARMQLLKFLLWSGVGTALFSATRIWRHSRTPGSPGSAGT